VVCMGDCDLRCIGALCIEPDNGLLLIIDWSPSIRATS
jgi:hypothetical protein